MTPRDVLISGLLLVGGASAFLLLAVTLWPRGLALATSTTVRRLLCALVVAAGFAATFVSGGWVEQRFRSVGAVLAHLPERVGETDPYEVRGHPALEPWIAGRAAAVARPSGDAAKLQRWQQALRQRLVSEAFQLEAGAPGWMVQVRELMRREVEGNVERVFLEFRSFDGTWIPAYLFLPARIGKGPAVLVVPGHSPRGIRETAGLVATYLHSAARELARAGLALTPELRGFGYLGEAAGTEHRVVAHNALLAGSFYKAVIARDLQRAVDLLLSRPEVDAARVAIAGVSLGGGLAVAYGALDERLAAVVVQGYGGPVGQMTAEAWAPGEDYPHYCHTIPGGADFLYEEDMFLLVAPRPMLRIRGAREPVPMEPLAGLLERTCMLLDAGDRFAWRIEDGRTSSSWGPPSSSSDEGSEARLGDFWEV